jgi:DNA polymerase-1
MQVHDELVFNMVPEEKEELKTQIQNIMENILEDAPIKLLVDVAEGNNWKEAK